MKDRSPEKIGNSGFWELLTSLSLTIQRYTNLEEQLKISVCLIMMSRHQYWVWYLFRLLFWVFKYLNTLIPQGFKLSEQETTSLKTAIRQQRVVHRSGWEVSSRPWPGCWAGAVVPVWAPHQTPTQDCQREIVTSSVSPGRLLVIRRTEEPMASNFLYSELQK